MNNHNSAIRIVLPALLLTAFVLTAPVQGAAVEGDSVQVSKLLSQAKAQAVHLSEDNTEMESFAQSDISWRSHVDAVDRIKEDVNLLGLQLAHLDAVRDTASPWQKTAIDRITPLLRELASNTRAVIEDLNESPRLRNTDGYRGYLETNFDDAAYLSSMISGFVDYGKTKARLDRLTSRLELEPDGD